MPLPKRQVLEHMLLTVLSETKGSMSVDAILSAVGKLAKIDPAYRPKISSTSNRSDLDYKLAWLRTALKKDGLIERVGFGMWKITSKGLERLHQERR